MHTHVKHDLYSVSANSVSSLFELSSLTARSLTAERGRYELGPVLDHHVPDVDIGDVRNLDNLGETVADLSNGQCLQEVEVEEGVHTVMSDACMHARRTKNGNGFLVRKLGRANVCARVCDSRSVVGTETVLELAVVDSDLDANSRVNECNQSCAHTDVVGATAVRCAGVADDIAGETAANNENGLLTDQTEIVHRVDKAEHSVHRLVQLAALEHVQGWLDLMRLKVCVCSESEYGA